MAFAANQVMLAVLARFTYDFRDDELLGVGGRAGGLVAAMPVSSMSVPSSRLLASSTWLWVLYRTDLTAKPLQLKVKEPAPDDLPADITSALCGRWLINQKGGDEYGSIATACCQQFCGSCVGEFFADIVDISCRARCRKCGQGCSGWELLSVWARRLVE